MTAVGIDLGTSNTVVACSHGADVRVLGDEAGRRLLPSVVSFHPNGDVLVGAPAKHRRVIDPRNTIANHKRLLGHSWNSPAMIEARKRSSFELREGPGQGALVHTRGQDYTLPEISAFILKRTRKLAEFALGERVERAVITVPAHFNELQRSATKVAGRVAGIEVMRILNEPTAAALAYGLGRAGRERVAVYDFGGGTFDCTLLDLNRNVYEVLATAGDSFLGGDDADTLVADRIADHLLATHRFDARADASSFERLKVAGEQIKIALSDRDVARTQLDDVSFGEGGAPLNVVFDLSRREFETMVAGLVERTLEVTREALTLARMKPESFDKVILVGGSTRMPLVMRRVAEFFRRAPLNALNPDEVVAAGAAIQAGALTSSARRKELPRAPVPAGSPKAVPLERAPAPPPAPLAGIFDQSPGPPPRPPTLGMEAPVLVDVTPRALVVETAGGYVDTVIPRNATIPCERTRNFATSVDRQTEVRVRVAQGEHTRFGGNTFLGEVLLSGLRPAIRGEVTIAVTFEIDADGTLQVRARDTVTNVEARTQVQLVATPDDSMVARMAHRFATHVRPGLER